MSNFNVGDIVVLTKDALYHYGLQYQSIEFEITHVATKYMNEDVYYMLGMPEGYHPGYDSAFNGEGLYDLCDVVTGEDFNNSLYHYELVLIEEKSNE